MSPELFFLVKFTRHYALPVSGQCSACPCGEGSECFCKLSGGFSWSVNVPSSESGKTYAVQVSKWQNPVLGHPYISPTAVRRYH